MFWRVSFDESDEVMEVRKYGPGIGGRKLAQVGELYHSHDFKTRQPDAFLWLPGLESGRTDLHWLGRSIQAIFKWTSLTTFFSTRRTVLD